MKISIELINGESIVHDTSKNADVQNGLYIIEDSNFSTYKYPIQNIKVIVEKAEYFE